MCLGVFYSATLPKVLCLKNKKLQGMEITCRQLNVSVFKGTGGQAPCSVRHARQLLSLCDIL